MLHTEKLKSIRKRKKISSKELAHIMGITRTTLSSWENGKIIPSEVKIRAIAKALEIAVNEISDLKVEKNFSETSLAPLASDIESLLLENDNNNQKDAQFLCSNIMTMSKKITEARLIIEAIFSSLPINFYIKGTDLSYISANEAFIQSLNLSKYYDIKGKKDIDLFPHNDAKINSEMDKNVINSGKSILNIEGHIPGSRNRKWCLISKIPIIDDKGSAEGLISYFIDITAKKKAEEELIKYRNNLEELVHDRNAELLKKQLELKDSELKFKTLFEGANDGIVVVDAITKKIVITNRRFCDMLGYDSAEILNISTEDIHPQEALPIVEAHFIRMQKGIFDIEFDVPVKRKDGSIFFADISANPIKLADKNFSIANFRDTTERKRILNLLKESEIHYRNLANSGQSLIWTSGLDMKCNYFNQPWLDFTGRTLDQEIGDGWTEGVFPDDLERCIKIYTESFKQQKSFSMEYRLRHFNGEYRWIQDDGYPRHSSSEFIGYIGHCLDITDRKNNQEELIRTKLLLEKSQQLAKIGGWELDLKTGKMNFTSGVFDIYGKTFSDPEEGMLAYHPEDRELVRTVFAQAIEKKSSAELEARFTNANSENLLVKLVSEPVIENGTVTKIIGNIMDITKSREVEIKLLESNKRFNDLFSNSPMQCVIFKLIRDKEGKIVDWEFSDINQLGAKSIGLTPNEAIGRMASELFGNEIMKPYLKLCREVVTDGQPRVIETHFDYNNRYYISSIYLVSSEYYAIISLDITDRKKDEAKLRTFFDLPLQGIAFTSSDKKWIEVNETICSMLGYTKKELQSLTWSELTYSEDLNKNLEQFENILSGHIDMYFLEKRFIRKNKDIIWVNLSVCCVRKPDRSVDYFVALLQDITDTKRSQTEKLEAEKRYQDLFNLSRDGIVTVDTSMRIVEANEAYCEMLGYTIEELRSMKSFMDITPKKWHINETEFIWKDKLLKKGYSGTFEKEYIHKNGTVFPVELNAFTIFDNEHNPKQMWAIVRNITERKKTELDLKKYQSLLAEIEEVGNVGGVELNIDTMKLIWTDGTYKIHEADQSYVPTLEKAFNFYTPASKSIIEKAVQRAIDHAESFDIELEIITAKGNRRNVHAIGKTDLENRRIYVFLQDITEQNKIKNELEIYHNRLEELVRERTSQLEEKNTLLVSAMANLKTLKSLLPICSSCKKIRDDRGYWDQVESYISKHSDTKFSHSICPDCLKQLYPNSKEKS